MANRLYNLFWGVLLVFALGLITAVTRAQEPQSTRQRTVGTADTQMSDKDERYRIGPGDVLEVIVYNHPQLSRPVLRVDGRGMIRLPLLEGEIQAACKTESELASDLTTRYLEYQKYPQVDVYVKEFNSQPIAILGAVRAPGRFQIQRRVRLLELLTYSGGPAPNAGRTIQIVHNSGIPQLCSKQNPSEDGDDSLSFYPIKDTLRGADAANPYLVAGDIVYLPDAEQAFVTGNVAKPSAIPLQEPVTLSRAIMMAGGLLPNSQSKIRIVRQDMTSLTKTEQYVDIKEVNRGTAKDIVLQANDVVEVVREGGAKSVLKAIMGAMIPTAALLPTRILY